MEVNGNSVDVVMKENGNAVGGVIKKNENPVITKNMEELVNTMDCCSMFPLFRLKRLFSKRVIKEWQQEDRRNVNFQVLTSLCHRGVSAWNDFIEVLWISGQKDAAKILKPEICAQEPTRVCNHCMVDASAAPSRMDNSAIFRPRVDNEKYYKMTSKPRGFCIMINNKDFEHEEDVRHQSELDAGNLEKAFKYLGYDVHLFNNLTHNQMLDVLKDFSQRQELEKHDSIAVVIMTHGNDKNLKGVDGVCVSEHEITILFNAVNCPDMKDKPKLFFIQACRGVLDDEGVLRLDTHYTDDEEDIPEDSPRVQRNASKTVGDAQAFTTSPCRRSSCYDPSHGDMLISYATVPGYRAYRTIAAEESSHLGSWYVKALHYRLVTGAHEKEIKDILNEVYKDVSEMETEEGFKQATTYENRGFHKELYFNPDYYEEA